jgi:hypothetical protein
MRKPAACAARLMGNRPLAAARLMRELGRCGSADGEPAAGAARGEEIAVGLAFAAVEFAARLTAATRR